MVFTLCEHKLPNGEICAKYTIDSSQHTFCDEHFMDYLNNYGYSWISIMHEYFKFHISIIRKMFTF